MRSLFYQKNLPFYLLIIFITFIVWYKILNQTFLGEGYYYFNSNLYLDLTRELNIGYLFKYLNYDGFAKLFFQAAVPIFKDNLQIYQLSAIIITTAFLIIFYKILSIITKDKFLSFTAIIFLSVNYYALFEYLAAGNYQRFIHRVPNLIPIVIAFYFQWKFFETKKYKLLVTSFLLYSFGVLMGHFSSMLLPLFIIYPLIKVFDKKINLKSVFLSLILCLAFTGITFLLTKNGDQKPAYGFFQFFQIEKNIPERILYQIPAITFPVDAMDFIRQLLPSTNANIYIETYRIFLIPGLILYIAGAFLVYKKLSKLFILYLTFLFSMISVMFLYMYIDPRLDVLKSFGEDRYFLPSLFFATTLWAIIIKALFLKSKRMYIAASLTLLTIFSLYNTYKIWSHIESIQYKSEMMEKFIGYFQENRDNFKHGSILIAPSYLAWPGSLITEVILKDKNAEFVLESHLLDKTIWEQKDRVYVYDYDYNNNGGIIDLTKKYRAGDKINF